MLQTEARRVLCRPSCSSLSRHTDHPSNCQFCSLTSHRPAQSPTALLILSQFCGHRRIHVSNGEGSYNQLFSMKGWVEQKGYWLLSLTALDFFKSWRVECRSWSPQASKVCIVSIRTLAPCFPAVLAVSFTGDWHWAKFKNCIWKQQSALQQNHVCLQLTRATPAFSHRKPPFSPQIQKPLFYKKRKCHSISWTRQRTVNYRG